MMPSFLVILYVNIQVSPFGSVAFIFMLDNKELSTIEKKDKTDYGAAYRQYCTFAKEMNLVDNIELQVPETSE